MGDHDGINSVDGEIIWGRLRMMGVVRGTWIDSPFFPATEALYKKFWRVS